jgi:tRNA-2-methylthio-N6-dimethylallyladenosine synthase
MATVRGDEIRSRFPDVKTVIPARELETFEQRILESWPELADSTRIESYPLLRAEEKFERFLPIIRGCINHCTYCIVPSARGDRLESKPRNAILNEIDTLLNSGVRSITFLGQNVCAYGSEVDDPELSGYGFAELLADIRDRFCDRDVWFKFLTSHPRDVNEKLIDVIASSECFSRHFHLPIQAGDDGVLKRMARGYTSSQYREMIAMIRGKIPQMRLSTDLIVGFPGEDECEFEHTMDIVRKIRFDQAFTFMYSPRAGTPAEKWADPVPLDVKKQRLQKLIEVQNAITLENARSHVGEERLVLIEGPSSTSSDQGMVAGRTREEEVVVLPGSEADYGNKVRVKLNDAKLRSFRGERQPVE